MSKSVTFCLTWCIRKFSFQILSAMKFLSVEKWVKRREKKVKLAPVFNEKHKTRKKVQHFEEVFWWLLWKVVQKYKLTYGTFSCKIHWLRARKWWQFVPILSSLLMTHKKSPFQRAPAWILRANNHRALQRYSRQDITKKKIFFFYNFSDFKKSYILEKFYW